MAAQEPASLELLKKVIAQVTKVGENPSLEVLKREFLTKSLLKRLMSGNNKPYVIFADDGVTPEATLQPWNVLALLDEYFETYEPLDRRKPKNPDHFFDTHPIYKGQSFASLAENPVEAPKVLFHFLQYLEEDDTAPQQQSLTETQKRSIQDVLAALEGKITETLAIVQDVVEEQKPQNTHAPLPEALQGVLVPGVQAILGNLEGEKRAAYEAYQGVDAALQKELGVLERKFAKAVQDVLEKSLTASTAKIASEEGERNTLETEALRTKLVEILTKNIQSSIFDDTDLNEVAFGVRLEAAAAKLDAINDAFAALAKAYREAWKAKTGKTDTNSEAPAAPDDAGGGNDGVVPQVDEETPQTPLDNTKLTLRERLKEVEQLRELQQKLVESGLFAFEERLKALGIDNPTVIAEMQDRYRSLLAQQIWSQLLAHGLVGQNVNFALAVQVMDEVAVATAQMAYNAEAAARGKSQAEIDAAKQQFKGGGQLSEQEITTLIAKYRKSGSGPELESLLATIGASLSEPGKYESILQGAQAATRSDIILADLKKLFRTHQATINLSDQDTNLLSLAITAAFLGDQQLLDTVRANPQYSSIAQLLTAFQQDILRDPSLKTSTFEEAFQNFLKNSGYSGKQLPADSPEFLAISTQLQERLKQYAGALTVLSLNSEVGNTSSLLKASAYVRALIENEVAQLNLTDKQKNDLLAQLGRLTQLHNHLSERDGKVQQHLVNLGGGSKASPVGTATSAQPTGDGKWSKQNFLQNLSNDPRLQASFAFIVQQMVAPEYDGQSSQFSYYIFLLQREYINYETFVVHIQTALQKSADERAIAAENNRFVQYGWVDDEDGLEANIAQNQARVTGGSGGNLSTPAEYALAAAAAYRAQAQQQAAAAHEAQMRMKFAILVATGLLSGGTTALKQLLTDKELRDWVMREAIKRGTPFAIAGAIPAAIGAGVLYHYLTHPLEGLIQIGKVVLEPVVNMATGVGPALWNGVSSSLGFGEKAAEVAGKAIGEGGKVGSAVAQSEIAKDAGSQLAIQSRYGIDKGLKSAELLTRSGSDTVFNGLQHLASGSVSHFSASMLAIFSFFIPIGVAGIITIIVMNVIGASLNDLPFGNNPSSQAGSGNPGAKFCWPADGTITDNDSPEHKLRTVSGQGSTVDISGNGFMGASVYAPISGQMQYYPMGSGPYGNSGPCRPGQGCGYGNYIIIQGNGMRVLLGHLLGPDGVPSGSPVQPGQLIARADNTGNSTGPHVHLEILDGNPDIDTIAPGGPVSVGQSVSHTQCSGTDAPNGPVTLDCITLDDSWDAGHMARMQEQLEYLKTNHPGYIGNICAAAQAITLSYKTQYGPGSTVRANSGQSGTITFFETLFAGTSPSEVLYTLTHELAHKWHDGNSGVLATFDSARQGQAGPVQYYSQQATRGQDIVEDFAETAAWYVMLKRGIVLTSPPYQNFATLYPLHYQFAQSEMFGE